MKVVWTGAAKADLRGIARYSVDRFGTRVAQACVRAIVEHVAEGARDPLGLRVIVDPHRMIRSGSHQMFLRVDVQAQRVIVMRILLDSMDVLRHLPHSDRPPPTAATAWPATRPAAS